MWIFSPFGSQTNKLPFTSTVIPSGKPSFISAKILLLIMFSSSSSSKTCILWGLDKSKLPGLAAPLSATYRYLPLGEKANPLGLSNFALIFFILKSLSTINKLLPSCSLSDLWPSWFVKIQ